MYNPPAFRSGDAESFGLIAARPLALLVSPSPAGLLATHLPMLLDGPDRLIGHVALANPHWRDFATKESSLAVFTGVDGYVSPGWYKSKAEHGRVVPTWNYEAVHVTGRLEAVRDTGALLEIVTKLTAVHEANRPAPWAPADAPADFLSAQLKGIVGLVLHIERVEGKAKLSQNRNAADLAGVIAEAADENPAMAMAAAVRAAAAR